MSRRSKLIEASVSLPVMQALVVDDSVVYRKLIGDHLRNWEFGVTLAVNGREAWQVLEQAGSPKLVLLDWVLPDLDGIELCRRIRDARSKSAYVYIILLTGKDGRQDMLEAMRAGADDYLSKPFDELELKARLMVGKRILELQEELVSARESMRHAATHDSLTGLLNRGEIVNTLERELERGRRDAHPLSLVLGDIDHFKKVNDTHGHLLGDEVLREVSRRLRQQLRVYDSVGRYGGEEFLMVLPNCDLGSALERAEQLRATIATTPVDLSGKPCPITMSMGVAVSSSEGKDQAEALLNLADAGLYAAKDNGRNQVGHFAPSAAGRSHKSSR
jgi:two-component system, cell cycle response regulator